jgi:hypothetical protein
MSEPHKAAISSEVQTMNQATISNNVREFRIPIEHVKRNRYGTVKDLEQEELADPDELARQAEFEYWLSLMHISESKHNSAWDCHASVDYNAFASIDFDRMMPDFDKAKYKADKFKEQLKDAVILINILSERIHDKRKYKLLKYAKSGVIDIDDISDWHMWQLATLYMRALGLRKQIIQLQDASRQRKIQRCEKWLDSLG